MLPQETALLESGGAVRAPDDGGNSWSRSLARARRASPKCFALLNGRLPRRFAWDRSMNYRAVRPMTARGPRVTSLPLLPVDASVPAS
jgi:hypothetical protein